MKTLSKKALFIYNPQSGKKKRHNAFPFIVERLTQLGYQLIIHQLTDFQKIEHPIKEACQKKWDAIFIAGGDGTVNSSLQTLATEQHRPVIAVIPLGTSNEFAKYIGMPSQMEEVFQVIRNGQTKAIDIGKFGDKYFANIASAGWLSDITYKTPSYLKAHIGEWAYVFCFLKTFIMSKQSYPISINLPSQELLSDLSLFLIMNGNGVGPFERLIKSNKNRDAHFHLLTCKASSRAALLLVLLCELLQVPNKATIIQHTTIQAGSFTIPQQISLNLDGDEHRVKDFQFTVLPRHLQVFTSVG
ncbi:diacylglycerol/lipid kinase family protein [Bacillus sp. FJAT-44742]|uniref:diacylglycerol/lipid kinase family protein n=1 Tax=Bacillus sp. FJAT-44742 TaxID=2014005 RepID=UPI000C2432F8|nr:YegS/Rv2252/BmrU family lipid kinase [Bacillus sp. FJAT-44742]